MILKSKNHQSYLFVHYSDVRDIPNFKLSKYKKNLFTFLLPELPCSDNKILFYNNNRINLAKPECSCNIYLEKSALYQNKKDIRCLCSHLNRKIFHLLRNIQLKPDNLILLLLENQYKFGTEQLLKLNNPGGDIIIGFLENKFTEWVNVYCKMENFQDKYFNYGFNIIEHRWRRNNKPSNHFKIEEYIKALIR